LIRLIRVVVDTNIFLSAFLFGGLPLRFVMLAAEGAFQMLTSLTLLDELGDKLRTKFKRSHEDAEKTRRDLEELCAVIGTTATLQVVKADPDDDRVLECAVAGRADYIVSGDKHLLTLEQFRGIPILTVRQFLDILNPPA
jgi:putative PIN family toxin of toxin-antitoxin system